jgi:hypothetical protein
VWRVLGESTSHHIFVLNGAALFIRICMHVVCLGRDNRMDSTCNSRFKSRALHTCGASLRHDL